jgi:predicted ATPase
MDPEDLREVISAYQKCVAETVGRFGGFVAKYMGDGVLIYFGYPQAHEDDAERAIRAGLELVGVVGALKTHTPLQTRVGIATGLVVVGELIGSGGSQEQAIVGETPNLAARLQGIAEPNSVVIAETTRKLVGNLFELEDLGSQELKGISGAVRAWAALRPASVESRFDALHVTGLTELVQGVAPHATYLFKHALVQDAAYGTLLREPRRALHARIAETLENEFAEIAENQPELLARHCTEAGLIEKAASLRGKAGQRSLASSALVEAEAQLTRALAQVEALPATPALRRQQIELQVAFVNALMHTKGYAAPQTKAAVERARLLIEQAQALGEPPEDPLLLFSLLYSFWAAHFVAFNGDALRELAARFLALAKKQGATGPLMIGHRLMGASLMFTGDIIEGKVHFDAAIALYDPAQHRLLSSRFGQDIGVVILANRSWTLWVLGYPDAAIADSERALKDAREIGQAATLMYALLWTSWAQDRYGNYVAASRLADELVSLADGSGSLNWKAYGVISQGCVLANTRQSSNAVERITSALTTFQSTGSTLFVSSSLLYLAKAYAELDQFHEAWRYIGEAINAVQVNKERWCEAEVNRVAGEIALKSSEPDVHKAEAHFERALTIARQQQAKSWELRASMSLARLWRDQGKVQEARELLAPVYGWFTEGFDTRDLKEAKALLEELAA